MNGLFRWPCGVKLLARNRGARHTAGAHYIGRPGIEMADLRKKNCANSAGRGAILTTVSLDASTERATTKARPDATLTGL